MVDNGVSRETDPHQPGSEGPPTVSVRVRGVLEGRGWEVAEELGMGAGSGGLARWLHREVKRLCTVAAVVKRASTLAVNGGYSGDTWDFRKAAGLFWMLGDERRAMDYKMKAQARTDSNAGRYLTENYRAGEFHGREIVGGFEEKLEELPLWRSPDGTWTMEAIETEVQKTGQVFDSLGHPVPCAPHGLRCELLGEEGTGVRWLRRRVIDWGDPELHANRVHPCYEWEDCTEAVRRVYGVAEEDPGF
jgi:hypothetical protein